MNEQKCLHCSENTNIDSIAGFSYNHYVKTNNNIVLHDHDFYELLFLPYEECEHFANGTQTVIPKQTIMFIRPEDCHDFINSELKRVRILHLAIQKRIIEELFEFLGDFFPSEELLSAPMPPYAVLSSYETEQLLSTFEQLHQIPVMDTKTKNILMRATLVDIFTRYFYKFKVFPKHEKKEIPDWLSNVCNAMKESEHLACGLDRMVELSHVTKEHLCRSIKKYLNMTASEYINDLRLTYISNMLIYSNEDIINLCYQCGFSNLSYMYALFKKKYGVSPAEFRRDNSLPFYASKNKQNTDRRAKGL